MTSNRQDVAAYADGWDSAGPGFVVAGRDIALFRMDDGRVFLALA
jgi:hypothetical protein